MTEAGMRFGPRKLLAIAGLTLAAVLLLAMNALWSLAGLIAGLVALLAATTAALLWALARLAASGRAEGRRIERVVKRSIKRLVPASTNEPGSEEAVLGAALSELAHTEGALDALRAALDRDPTRAEWRLKLANVLLSQGRRDEAKEHVLRLPRPGESTFELYRPDVRFETVRLLGDLGIVDDVVAVYLGEIQAQLDARQIDNAHVLAEAAVAVQPGRIRAHDLLISTLDAKGETDRALHVARENAVRRIKRLDRQREPVLTPRQLDQESRLFLSGFFYSGSGAVLDWLRGFPSTVKWAPVGEMRLIKFPGGLFDLISRYQENGFLSAQDLVDHYLHITGWKVTPVPTGRYSRIGVVNKNSRRLFRDERANGYLRVCLDGFIRLADEGVETADQLRLSFRDTVARALDAVATDFGVDVVLVDQAVTAWHLEMATLVPPSTFVVVHRDPRDQFAEARQVVSKPGRSRRMRSASGFVEVYRRNRAHAEEHMPRLVQEQGHRVLRVCFEDFVLDHETEAQRLADALGFDGMVIEDTHFHAEQSRENIGKYRSLLTADEIATIEGELAEFLHPDV